MSGISSRASACRFAERVSGNGLQRFALVFPAGEKSKKVDFAASDRADGFPAAFKPGKPCRSVQRKREVLLIELLVRAVARHLADRVVEGFAQLDVLAAQARRD